MGLQGDSRTEAEELEDPVHGVADVGRVVFQAKNEELFFTENSEPVQEIHGVQPDLQPHLGPERRCYYRSGSPSTARRVSESITARPYKPTPRSDPGKPPSSEAGP